MNLYHYYHVYADGDWEPILHEHLRALKSSGLYDELASFNVGLVGDLEQRESVLDVIDDYAMRCHVVAEADSGWEQVTLDALAVDYRSHWDKNGIVLYAHTKGAAYPGEFPDAWRRAMTEKCIGDWRSIYERMTEGSFDTAGAFYIEEHMYEPTVPVFAGVHGVSTVVERLTEAAENAGVEYNYGGEIDEPQPVGFRYHYSGNFWWSTLDWIRRLPYPCPNVTRFDAEMWIGKTVNGSFPRALDLRSGSPFDQLRRQQ